MRREQDDFGVDVTNNAYKDAGRRVCVACSAEYHSYSKSRKFCSHGCYTTSRSFLSARPCSHCGTSYQPKTSSQKFCSPACNSASQRKPEVKREKRQPHLVECATCAAIFRASPSSNRKFCSYDCHLKSGGAERAGRAAAMAKTKYGAKKDANHREVFDAISRFTAVHDLSNAGFGVPDGIAWINGGWQLFDVKNPATRYGKRGLNERQQKWANDWRGGPVYLIYTAEEAIRFAKGQMEGIAKFPPDTVSPDWQSIGCVTARLINETARKRGNAAGPDATAHEKDMRNG